MQKIRKLTIKELIQSINSLVVFSLVLGLILVGIFVNYNYFTEIVSDPLILIVFASILIVSTLVALLLIIKKRKKENDIFKNREFKIVEDKIYDKYYRRNSEHGGCPIIYSKIFGEVVVDSITYNNAKKNDLIYFIIHKSENCSRKYDRAIDEGSINNNIIIRFYLDSLYDFDDELQSYIIPYDESLGELNFNNRIKDLIEEQKKNQYWFTCKNCNKKYYKEEDKVCPNCGLEYEFDIKDVVNMEEWY